MTETPEAMRQHIEETKSQLWDKLDTLESQVSEAVTETVASVQETVSNVTDTVQDSVQSVSNAFDLPLQIERHPWIAFGGSFVLGYLASELLSAPPKKSECEPCTEPRSSASATQSQNGNGQHTFEPTQSSSSSSRSWAEMRGMLTGTLMGAVSAMVSRGVPTVMDYLAKTLHSNPNPNDDPLGGAERRHSPK
ncbi:MAG: hypothetical protein IAG10_19590 [Planctomycetaceae bacterium]|nr:hypothetical protein [Planctomycetaceae bacterium]